MKQALERHENKESTVIPVILHPCDWHDMPFGKLLAGTIDGKPISKFPNMHDGFLEVTKAVKNAVSKIHPTNIGTASETSTATQPQPTGTTHSPRSSNLRIAKSFTDRDKDTFINEAFEYIAKYFEGSLLELELRNSAIETSFKRIDVNTFSATIYVNGSATSNCKIWHGEKGSFSLGSGIMYSTGGHGNSYNESLTVKNDNHSIYLKTLGMSFHQQTHDSKLSLEGGAEYYWSMFIQQLQ